MKYSSSKTGEDKENQTLRAKVQESSSRSFGTEIVNTSTHLPSSKSYLEYYADDIYPYLHSIESLHTAKFGYMKNQFDINEKMRAILIDWLVEVHLKFKLLPETLYLSVNIIDRYLESLPITRGRLQLLGVTSLFVASKYEEIYAPEIHDFVHITDKLYDRDDIIGMEASILKVLSFHICTPSSFRFLERYAMVMQCDEKQFALARYFIELCLLEYKMLRFSRSIIAASSLYLMNKVSGIHPEWPEFMLKHTPYCENELKICAKEIFLILQRNEKSNLQAIRKKFMQPLFHGVACVKLI